MAKTDDTVKPSDITEAVNVLLKKLHPDEYVYVNLLPDGFTRPSSLIENTGVRRVDANRSTVAIEADIDITCYVKTDGHYNSDTQELLERQESVMGLFERGYLKVKDRHISVTSREGDITFTECNVYLTFDYFEDRASIGETEYQTIETIQTKYETGG